MKTCRDKPCNTSRSYFKKCGDLSEYKASWLNNERAVFEILAVKIAIVKDHLHTSIWHHALLYRRWIGVGIQCPKAFDKRLQFGRRRVGLVIHPAKLTNNRLAIIVRDRYRTAFRYLSIGKRH